MGLIMKKKTKKQSTKKTKKPVAKKVQVDKGIRVIAVGQYGHEAAAKREAAEYMLPNIFQYRPAVFIPPSRYGIEVQILDASPVEMVAPETPVYTWTVLVTLKATGPTAAVNRWLIDFEKAAKYYTP